VIPPTVLPNHIQEIVAAHARRVEPSAFDQCYAASVALTQALRSSGVEVQLIQVAGLLAPAPSADARWLSLPATSWLHYAVQIGDTVVDLTRQQFFPADPQPFICPAARYAAQWSTLYQID
jgi:hypothetical protein